MVMDARLTAIDTETEAVYRAPTTRLARHIIEAVSPQVDCGRYPAKRIVGDDCIVEADVFRDGHEVIRASVKWRRKQDDLFSEAPMTPIGNDRWRGQFPL